MSSSTAIHCPSSPSFTTLPRYVFDRLIAPLLTTADLLSFYSADRAIRQLLLTPHLWRNKQFRWCPFAVSSSSFRFWCGVVQLMSDRMLHGAEPAELIPSVDSLAHFPALRHFSATCAHVAASQYSRATSLSCPAVTSLASLRCLTRLTLHARSLTVLDMRLLSTLPVLTSFIAQHMRFESGSEQTLTEWLAVSGKKKQRTKRKLEEGESEEDEADADEEKQPDFEVYSVNGELEDPDDPSLPQRYSPLLLFLHSLAAKPSFVHLRLAGCYLTPFVLDSMSVWPHLLCLSIWDDELTDYPFVSAASCFPSLTSLTSPNCSNTAIKQLVRLPKLEELRFPHYSVSDEEEGGVRTTARGFRAIGASNSLRAVQYTPPEGGDTEVPSLAALTALFTLSNLTRLTVGAHWLFESSCVQLFTHRFDHLRCLELIAQYGCGFTCCPQTDAALLPLVKPPAVVVIGRDERQAARATKRRVNWTEVGAECSDDEEESHDIPADNAANFPILECLALPYTSYHTGDDTGRVSAWMKRQLRRSYEYEVAAEWEAEMVTLGEAELLRSMA